MDGKTGWYDLCEDLCIFTPFIRLVAMVITNRMDANKKATGSKTRVIVYQPVTPACNKTLRRKWDDEMFNNHRERVRNARSLIDNKAPRIFFPMNLKKAQVSIKMVEYYNTPLKAEEQRKAKIDKSNRMMLEKIAHIMKTKGGVDDWNSKYQNNKQVILLTTIHHISFAG